MPKFRKKPVEIEAWQWNPTMQHDFMPSNWPEWLRGRDTKIVFGDGLEIPTLEGVMRANKGDWIIHGVKGEVYPCKPDIFAATYDPV
jgi:hypothetical protein